MAINDSNAMEVLMGHALLVDAQDRPPLEPGEFHLLDLVGLEVLLLAEASQPIGRVSDLIHAGNDLLDVELCAAANASTKSTGAGRRILIPFVEAIVPVVELAEGWIGIPPPGLLDL